jgi:predicted TIM-barrel fold metal-dependent hydrolase
LRERPIYFSYEPEEKLLPETFRYVGDNHFVYATDIPHWDAEFPENLHMIQAREDLSEKTKNRVLYENAKSLYQI